MYTHYLHNKFPKSEYMNNLQEPKPQSREKIENSDLIEKNCSDLQKDYNKIIDILNQNKDKSNFIVDLWKNYLSKKKISFEKDIQHCYQVINILNETNANHAIPNIETLSYETIALLKVMFLQ